MGGTVVMRDALRHPAQLQSLVLMDTSATGIEGARTWFDRARLVGELDAPFRAPSDDLAATIPGSRLVVQPGACHCPQEDDPTVWTTTMQYHLRTTSIAH
jgi:pimeloyl-ACP methyl ester carboxylesterase